MIRAVHDALKARKYRLFLVGKPGAGKEELVGIYASRYEADRCARANPGTEVHRWAQIRPTALAAVGFYLELGDVREPVHRQMLNRATLALLLPTPTPTPAQEQAWAFAEAMVRALRGIELRTVEEDLLLHHCLNLLPDERGALADPAM